MSILGNYVKIKTGKLDANAASTDGNYPFFTCAITPLKIDSYSYDCECTLIAGNGDLNVKYYNGKFDAYQRTYIVESKDKTVLSVPYLYRFLEKYVETLRTQAIGGVIKYIKLGNITNAQIAIKPLTEQNRIVDILDKVDELLNNLEQQGLCLDTLVKSRFIEMFGEYMDTKHQKKLKEVCDFIDYRGKTPEKAESGIPLITAKNVRENHFSEEPREYIPAENYEAVMTRGIPKVNDVLFTTEAPLGNVCRIPNTYDKFCVGQRIVTIQPHDDKLISEYLERVLLSNDFQNKVWRQATGSTVKGIRSKRLIELTIPVPPLDLQKQFADFVAFTDKSKLAVQQSIETLQTLKAKLMQDYFG